MKPALKYSLRLLFTVAVLGACFVAFDVEGLPRALSQTDLGFFILAVALSIIGTIVIPAVVTRLALRGERIELSIVQLIRVNFIIRLYSLVLPKGVATSMRWLRYREAGSGGDALATIVFENALRMLMMVVAATACLIFERDRLPLANGWFVAAAVVALVGGLAGMSPFFSPKVSRRLKGIANRPSKRLPTVIARPLTALWRAVCAFQSLRAPEIVALFALGFVGFLATVGAAWSLAVGMDLPLSPLAIIWTRALLFLVLMIPLTIAGFGIREISLVAALGLYGISESSAIAYSLMLFAMQAAIGLIGGAFELWDHFVAPSIGAKR